MRIYTSWCLLISMFVHEVLAGEWIDRIGRPLPSPRSAAARIAHLEFVNGQYGKLLKEIQGLSLKEQQDEIVTFHTNILKPIGEDLQKSGFYIPYYSTLESNLLAKLCEIKFCIAAPYAQRSAKDCAYAFERYEYLSDRQRKEHKKHVKQLWHATLQYGTDAHIRKLCSEIAFSSEQIEMVYKRMLTYPIDEQIAFIHVLNKKCLGFSDHIEYVRKQNSAAWHIHLRNCIANNQSKALLKSFKAEDGRIIDQLFMNTMLPFLSAKNGYVQRAVANVLERWNGTPCANNDADVHTRYEVTWELIHNNSTFKKQLESDTLCGAAVTQWWANMQVLVWKARVKKQSFHKSFHNERLHVLKGAESTFARITPESAAILVQSDNELRLTMHGGVLCGLLNEFHTTEKMAYAWCERALKAGVNIADKGYVTSIAHRMSSASFLKIVEPYLDKNLDLCHSLGLLYENGHSTVENDKMYIWLLHNTKKAQELYKKMMQYGDMRACTRWISLVQKTKNGMEKEKVEEDIAQFLNEMRNRFPRNISLKIQACLFICNLISGVTKNTVTEHKIMLMDKLADEMVLFKSRLKTDSPELVHFSALQASYEAVNYDMDVALGAPVDEKETMEHLANLVHATYVLSMHSNFSRLHEITNFFDASVYTNLRRYAEKIVCKDPKTITAADLNTLAIVGYMTVGSKHHKGTFNKSEALFLEKIIELSAHKDIGVRCPPLISVLALARFNKDDNPYKILPYVKCALQEGIASKDLDRIALFEAKQTLEMLALGGSIRAQMEFIKHNKENIRATVTKLITLTKPIIAISKKDVSEYIKEVNACGGYALLRKAFLKSCCTECCADMLMILTAWITGLVLHADNSSDPLLKPFFDDSKLFKSFMNGTKGCKKNEEQCIDIQKQEDTKIIMQKLLTLEQQYKTIYDQLHAQLFTEEDQEALSMLMQKHPTDPIVHALCASKYALGYDKTSNPIGLSKMILSLEQARRLCALIVGTSNAQWLNYITPLCKEILWRHALTEQCKSKAPETAFDFNVIGYAAHINKEKSLTERKELLQCGLGKHPLCSSLYIGCLLQEHGCVVHALPLAERFIAYRALHYGLMQGQQSEAAASQLDSVTYLVAKTLLNHGTEDADLGCTLITASTLKNPALIASSIGSLPFKQVGNQLVFDVPCNQYIKFAEELKVTDILVKQANQKILSAQEAMFRLYFGKVYEMVSQNKSLNHNFMYSILSYGVPYLKAEKGERLMVIKKYVLSLLEQLIKRDFYSIAYQGLKDTISKIQ